MVTNLDLIGALGTRTRTTLRARGPGPGVSDLIPGRHGARLYDALIEKLDGLGSFRGGPTRRDLINLREEHLHAPLAEELVTWQGWDLEILAPCVMLQSVESRAIIEVIVSDPSSTLVEALEAILVAELADHESWIALGRAATAAGEHDLATTIADAESIAAEHISKVRRWLIAAEASRPRSGRSHVSRPEHP